MVQGRIRALALLATFSTPLPAAGAELSQVRVVYLLPMGNGLDQYLANRLTGEQLFQVVTDHRKADAVLTDQIGGGFEERMKELYPPPSEPKPEEAKKDKEKGEEGVLKGDTGIPRSRFTRGRGNLFLVDVNSRRVLWSVFELPKSSSPDELDRASRRIVENLKRAIEGK